MGYVMLVYWRVVSKKIDAPSLQVLIFYHSKLPKKCCFLQTKFRDMRLGAPVKDKMPKRNFSKYSQKMLAKKKAKKNRRKCTTYVLENVVKKLLVFPPPSSKGIFVDTQGCS